jgi:hypothetical protein
VDIQVKFAWLYFESIPPTNPILPKPEIKLTFDTKRDGGRIYTVGLRDPFWEPKLLVIAKGTKENAKVSK